MAEVIVTMMTELRYTIAALAAHSILVDTGQYQPTYRMRTYADMEAECGNWLANQPNFRAKVKMLFGEHVIRTNPAPQGLSDGQLTARIRAIKERMISVGICRYAREVEKEIADRHEQLRSSVQDRPRRRHAADDPPPAYA